MCDYSLNSISSRPARVGDKLVSSQFRNSITRGLAAVDEPEVAVCLLPGTEVAFEQSAQRAAALPFFRNRSLNQKLARFRQINLDRPAAHHDALEFPDGQIVKLNDLVEDQHVTVLQLPARAPIEAESAERAPASTMA